MAKRSASEAGTSARLLSIAAWISRTNFKFQVAFTRTGKRQQESGGAAEIVVEIDGSGTVRQGIVQGIQPQIDGVEHLHGIFDAVVELNLDDRNTRKRQ